MQSLTTDLFKTLGIQKSIQNHGGDLASVHSIGVHPKAMGVRPEEFGKLLPVEGEVHHPPHRDIRLSPWGPWCRDQAPTALAFWLLVSEICEFSQVAV